MISKDRFELTTEGTTAAKSVNNFKNILAAQIIEYLDNNGFGIKTILDTIDTIEAPDLPEASTIFGKGKTNDTKIEEAEFRKVLYLLYLCERLDREVKHLYFRKS